MKRVSLICAGIIIAFGIGEGFVRMGLPQPPFNHDPLNRGMFTQPGKHHYHTTEFSTVVQVNSNGFVMVFSHMIGYLN